MSSSTPGSRSPTMTSCWVRRTPNFFKPTVKSSIQMPPSPFTSRTSNSTLSLCSCCCSCSSSWWGSELGSSAEPHWHWHDVKQGGTSTSTEPTWCFLDFISPVVGTPLQHRCVWVRLQVSRFNVSRSRNGSSRAFKSSRASWRRNHSPFQPLRCIIKSP